MSDDYSGDYLTARDKINQGVDWRGTANVPVDGETMQFGHRLLNETEFHDLKRVIPLSELREYKNSDESDAEKRLQELQQKDELSDAEERELEQLQAEVAAMQDDIEDALGEDAYDEIMRAGRRAIMPTEDDVEDIINAPHDVQRRVLGEVPQMLDFDTAEELLKEDMVETVSQQPYPIKFTVGMQAFAETVRVLGNGIRREDAT